MRPLQWPCQRPCCPKARLSPEPWGRGAASVGSSIGVRRGSTHRVLPSPAFAPERDVTKNAQKEQVTSDWVLL